MRKLIKATIFFFACLIVLSISSFVFAQEKINNFDVQAQIKGNSSVLITEDIFYDLGSDEGKHGIFRDIYSKDIIVEVEKVVDENGNEHQYKIINSKDNVRVQIGDANQTITGQHHYVITYLVKGAIKFLADHDEFYWNVTGNNWPAPIGQVIVNVSLPQIVSKEKISLKCYTGSLNSVSQDCQYFNSETIEIINLNPLAVGEGLTIVVGWPKGVVSPPSTIEKITDFTKRYWPFALPIIVFVYLFITWWKKGRDIKLHKSIVPQYDLPNDLRPVEVAYILNQKITPRDISAMIVDLAVRGYIKIKETEKKNLIGKSKDWVFLKQKDFEGDATLEEFERRLLRGIFGLGGGVAVSDMKKDFYKDIEDIKDEISQEMVLDEYFVSDPDKAKRKFITIGIVVLVIFYVFVKFVAFGFFSTANFWVPLLISGILFIAFGAVMPKKTSKGTEVMWYILGFKEYITKAEKYRAQFQEKENIFEKFLPYAIIFGCTKKWAKAFEGIYKTPPTWYEGAVYGAYFSPVIFSKSLNTSLAGIGTALAARPGGGASGSGFSGGFSGGGFGGGGGGSW